MSESLIFSSPEQITKLADVLSKYIRLPFSTDTIPGAVLEGALAFVRNAEVLKTYDFVDVIKQNSGIGWQVKSTKATTPVTWKRAKIPNQEELMESSFHSEEARQTLGNTIIEFCNEHAEASLKLYDLSEIGYSRLVVFDDGKVLYFERLLCTQKNPRIFNPNDFEWHWSTPKRTVKKEQLPALHGYHKESGKKWFAWHGLGENQLHFSGERNWWLSEDEPHAIAFDFPKADERLELEKFIELLSALDIPH
ncbi:hypothetical protein BH10ACI1_BH10ACI1_23520 [soil metagenome]